MAPAIVPAIVPAIAPALAAGATDSVPPLPAPAQAAFREGRALLAQSAQREQVARQAILDANRTRGEINARRASLAARTEPSAGAALQALAQQLESQQQAGAQARTDSDELRRRAMRRLAEGLSLGWPRWVLDTQPLTMDDEVRQVFAHNTAVRSVHPNQPDAGGRLQVDGTAAAQGLSLQLPRLAAQQAPQDLDIAAFQLSRSRQVLAHIEVEPAPGAAPGNAAAVPLNRLHRWRLLLSDLDGRPLAGATVAVAGHMPGHVHGLPTQPRVTQALAPGVYLVEGLKFQMAGWWVLQFELGVPGSNQPPDNVAFNLVF